MFKQINCLITKLVFTCSIYLFDIPFMVQVGKWPIHVQVSHYAGVACRRLERIGQCGKKQPRKPNTEDIDQARVRFKKYLLW